MEVGTKVAVSVPSRTHITAAQSFLLLSHVSNTAWLQRRAQDCPKFFWIVTFLTEKCKKNIICLKKITLKICEILYRVICLETFVKYLVPSRHAVMCSCTSLTLEKKIPSLS